MRACGDGPASGIAGGPAILPVVGRKSTQGRIQRKRINAGDIDAGNDCRLLRRPNGRGEEFERNLIAAGFTRAGGGVYVAAFIRFIHMLAPGYHTIDRNTVRRWIDGEDNAVAAALVRVVQIPSAEITRMIHEACQWGGRQEIRKNQK